ncbi:hypothetical protein FXO38_14451 [Capsicum annuum]|nr:hypothetical protein FXO38_14451 [Capsicum annuum]KAF3685929.1 hypothetical protein FXO37_00131 [Capsicum annuum]
MVKISGNTKNDLNGWDSDFPFPEDGEATKKRRNEGSISEKQKLEGQENGERPSVKAKRARFSDVIPNNMPKCATNITKHSPGYLNGSCLYMYLYVFMSMKKGDVLQNFIILEEGKLIKPSCYHASSSINNDKVQKLLMMPLNEVLLPKIYSVLVTSLPIHVGSSNLSVDKEQALEELEKYLPSLCTSFHHAKRQEDDHFSKIVKVNLIDKLTKSQERYKDLKNHRIEIDASISKLKANLKKEEMNKRAIEEQEINLKNEISPLEATLEELGAESLIHG